MREITEIRCYNLNADGAPELAIVFAFPSEENPSVYGVVARTYSNAAYSGKYAGVEYVVDAHGPDEEVTDWDGDCPTQRNLPEDSGTWAREMAMEAGMLHGVDAYNEVMGY
jgi:hypothetical protein